MSLLALTTITTLCINLLEIMMGTNSIFQCFYLIYCYKEGAVHIRTLYISSPMIYSVCPSYKTMFALFNCLIVDVCRIPYNGVFFADRTKSPNLIPSL